MRKIYTFMIAIVIAIFVVGCNSITLKPAKSNKVQDIQIYSASNVDATITKDTIENSFKQAGFAIDGNNNMNTPFKQRFKAGEDFKTYRLMFVHNPKLVTILAKDYPSIGLISPLSTSIYSKDGKVMNISTLTLAGMSKITKIPTTNKTLIAIYENINKALKLALPNGKFKELNYKIKKPNGSLITTFTTTIEGDDLEEEKEGFQEEMEAEIEPVGFIVAGFVNLNDEFKENGVDVYDFYDTYSICKLDVIYPVHITHPEVGAFAPCSLYMYKKKSEEKTHLGFPSVLNWISSTDIEDDKSLKPLLDAQNLLETIITEISE